MPHRQFVWDDVDDCVLEETDESGNTLVTYTREPGPFGPLTSEYRNGTTYTHHYDALGSTQFLTDDTGNITDTFTYDAWGNEVARTGTTETPYRWCGRWGYQFDQFTGGYYIRARNYQPIVARWISVDKLGFTDGLNCYCYAQNKGPIRIDPSGLVACGGTPVGVVYLSGRGEFHGLRLTPQRPRSQWHIRSEASINWVPLSDDSFTESGNCGDICCCDLLGYIQIAKQTVKTNDWATNWWLSHGWRVDSNALFYDTSTSGGLSGGQNANPCPPWKALPRVSMVDSPEIWIQFLLPGYRVYNLEQEFEACVACISGNEGPNISTRCNSHKGGKDSNTPKGITVYGCVKWHHSRWLRFSKYELMMANRTISVRDIQNDEIAITTYVGDAPSNEFKNTVLNHRWYG